MYPKFNRLSYNQLRVAAVFLSASSSIITHKQLSKKTGLAGKSLGGVLSALSRTKWHGVSLIDPIGRPQDQAGFRWRLSPRLANRNQAKKQVSNILKTYDD